MSIAPSSDQDASTRMDEATGASSQRARPLNLSGRVVLLATDGSEGSIAGAHVALALAAKYHATIHVVSVVDTRSAPIPPPLDIALAMGDAVIGPVVHKQQEEEVRSSLSTATGQAVAWPIRITLGTPAISIVKEARRVGAVLIIVGLRRHGRLERAVHDETAIKVMRNSSCPVLGIVSGTTTLPTRVLAAVDFSETSLIAARAPRVRWLARERCWCWRTSRRLPADYWMTVRRSFTHSACRRALPGPCGSLATRASPSIMWYCTTSCPTHPRR